MDDNLGAVTLINMKKNDTLEDAQRHASAEVTNTGAFSLPVIVFHQGTRTCITGALPMGWIKDRLMTRSAKAKGSLSDVHSAGNRPEYLDHSSAIAKYLIENYQKKYIVPPLTLNIQQKVNLYVVNYGSDAPFVPGYLVISPTARLSITDGQHRRTGIIRALDQMTDDEVDQLASNAVAVMITCETDIDQIHQDFADCSRTKPIPPSLLAVYDRRNPANRVVLDLEKNCHLFSGRIDPTSTSLSKKSAHLFLANQLRQLAKELLVGSYAMSDAAFERRAIEQLSEDSRYNEAVDKYSAYINCLTTVIPVWADITKLSGKIPDKRAEGWVCLTATGLNLIGRIGHKIFTTKALEENWMDHTKNLGQLDWQKEANMWQGTIVQNNRIMNQQVPLKRAFENVCKILKLD